MLETAAGILIAMFVAGLFALGVMFQGDTPELTKLGNFFMGLALVIGAGIVFYAFW